MTAPACLLSGAEFHARMMHLVLLAQVVADSGPDLDACRRVTTELLAPEGVLRSDRDPHLRAAVPDVQLSAELLRALADASAALAPIIAAVNASRAQRRREGAHGN